jgi:SAM-dependent methyltransferase
MAPEVVWDELPSNLPKLKVLDPMAGSGTTLVTAKLRGHQVVGFDMDPLAILISNAWLSNVSKNELETKAAEVLSRAESRAQNMALRDAYPRAADDETKKFVRYWFDQTNRRQLTALSQSISLVRDPRVRNLLWCAFSRLIITKKVGVSLAMDVSHSRPHRTYDVAPVRAFDRFLYSVKFVMNAAPFSGLGKRIDTSLVQRGDARRLPLASSTIDIVITSPPYLNAIDYIRGHKLSLIWMGHSISDLRAVRSTNVGSEKAAKETNEDKATEEVMRTMCSVDSLSTRNAGMLRQYVRDMRGVLAEIQRVLRPAGKAVLVVGDCNLKDSFVSNSTGILSLASELGLQIEGTRRRLLPENRRYLPPPQANSSGEALKMRMREEVIINLSRP